MRESQHYAPLLSLLTLLFLLRVVAQLALLIGDIPGLPSFEHWHSGTMPYPLLVFCQLLILTLQVSLCVKFANGSIKPKATLGRVLLVLGTVYFVGMLARLILGLTLLSDSRWFSNAIPTFFHLILASYVLLLACFNLRCTPERLNPINNAIKASLPWIIYPAIMTVALFAHYVMAYHWQINLTLATFVPVISAGLLISALEYLLPQSKSWHASAADIKTDALYMAIVQLVLPKLFIPILLVLLLPVLGQLADSTTISFWPRDLPIWQQTIIMILLADFLRYWLHRACHTNPTLWRLHAIHHSPDKLYWFNVGRFHPLEKALQLLFDTLPFVLLGVDAKVIALYYVFYSINGFFQHCNIRLKFGLANYLISSAQLHRWHHSKIALESNNNYGNNLIVWDLLFGSYLHPNSVRPTTLGIIESPYPNSFVRQVMRPFKPKAIDTSAEYSKD